MNTNRTITVIAEIKPYCPECSRHMKLFAGYYACDFEGCSQRGVKYDAPECRLTLRRIA